MQSRNDELMAKIAGGASFFLAAMIILITFPITNDWALRSVMAIPVLMVVFMGLMFMKNEVVMRILRVNRQ